MTTWRDDAACRDMDPRIFFPTVGATSHAALARSICAGCPVAEECLTACLTNEEGGDIWGGTTRRERDGLRRARGLHRPLVSACGTDSGYTRHRRDGEPACEPCKAARAEAWRRRNSIRLAS